MKELIISTALAVSLACPVAAQQNCAPRPVVVTQLQSSHGEFQQSVGIDQRGNMVEMFANPETGSWTAIVTLGNGMACQASAGEGWRRTGVPPVEGDPA